MMSSLKNFLIKANNAKHVFASPVRQCQNLLSCQPLVAIVTKIAPLYLYPHRRHVFFVSDAKSKRLPARDPRNNEIKSEIILVVDQSGIMTGPHRTCDVLRDFDYNKNMLVKVAEGNEEYEGIPVCRIMDRAVVRQSELNTLNKKKNKGTPTKVIEISWVVEKHDLNTKLRRVREFLEKGWKVNILLKAKKKGKPVTSEDADNLIKSIYEVISDAGAKLTKPVEGQVLDAMEICLQGKTKVSKPSEEISKESSAAT